MMLKQRSVANIEHLFNQAIEDTSHPPKGSSLKMKGSNGPSSNERVKTIKITRDIVQRAFSYFHRHVTTL